jgi:hypothetical protein
VEYYATLRGELSLNDLYSSFPHEAMTSERETWNVELGSPALSEDELSRRIMEAVGGNAEWVLIGGGNNLDGTITLCIGL